MNIQRPTHEEISRRAYQIYLDRGAQDGHDRDDWLQAEYELMQLPVRKIAELPLPRFWKNKKKAQKTPSLIHVVKAAMGGTRGAIGQQPSA